METITKVITEERKPAFLTPEAHAVLPRLCKLIAQKKGLSGISYLDAASIAILEAYERYQREKAEEK